MTPAHVRPPLTGYRSPRLSPSPLLIRTSLLLALVAGFSLGLYLVLSFAFGWGVSSEAPELVQVHGQVQTIGFVGLFIFGVATQLFPRFHAVPLDRPQQVSLGGLALAIGVALRVLAQPFLTSEPRAILVVASGVLELAGALLVLAAFSRVIRGSVQPAFSGAGVLLPLTIVGSLLAALLLNLVACVGLATGDAIVPFHTDEALLHLELWGFASTMIFAVAGRIYPRFLLLQPVRERLLLPAFSFWAIGTFGTALVWLAFGGQPLLRSLTSGCQLVGAALFLLALRLYERPARASTMPRVTDPTRLWARLAFGFLLVAASANLGLALHEVAGGVNTFTALSAARHALAQGFLLPVIVYMAARILPGYSGFMLHRDKLLVTLIGLLFLGGALRFGAEISGGYAPDSGALVALGGALGVLAFVVFAAHVWRSIAGVPRGLNAE